MSLYSYEIFNTVVECGSFVKAAEILNLTPSAISHTISNLEKKFGFKILIRNKSGVKLTLNGENLLPYIQSILKLNENLNQEISKISNLLSGIVRIGTISSINISWIPHIVKNFRKLYPNIEVQIFQGGYGDVINWMKNYTIDIGFVSKTALKNKNLDNDFDFTSIYKDRLMCITPPNWFSKNKKFITFDEILDKEFIIQYQDFDEDTNELFKKNNLSILSNFKMQDDFSIFAMVENGFGVSIVPELVTNNKIANVNCYPLNPSEYRTIGIITNDFQYITPATKVMKKEILKYIEAIK